MVSSTKTISGALFDKNGYILFLSENEYLNCGYLKHGIEVHIKDGIFSIPNYIKVKSKETQDKITKEKIINISERFMQEALEANCYYDIIKQYSENKQKYYEEMSFSGAFYTYTYNALIVAVFMELAKIYDRNKDSVKYREVDEYL